MRAFKCKIDLVAELLLREARHFDGIVTQVKVLVCKRLSRYGCLFAESGLRLSDYYVSTLSYSTILQGPSLSLRSCARARGLAGPGTSA